MLTSILRFAKLAFVLLISLVAAVLLVTEIFLVATGGATSWLGSMVWIVSLLAALYSFARVLWKGWNARPGRAPEHRENR